MDTQIKNISRQNSEFKKGWYVRIMRQGQRKTKYFSDAAYGGRMESLDAAIKYRDRLVKRQDARFKAHR